MCVLFTYGIRVHSLKGFPEESPDKWGKFIDNCNHKLCVDISVFLIAVLINSKRGAESSPYAWVCGRADQHTNKKFFSMNLQKM